MAGQRQPIDLVVAKGKAHMAQSTIQARRDQEVKPPKDGTKFIRAPDWLPKELKNDFNDLRRQLVDLDIFLEMDRDSLGRYLVSMHGWLEASKLASQAITKKDPDGARDWSAIQERYFKQARNCANDMGMTITSRCRLVVPTKKDEDEDDPFLRVIEGRRNA